MYLILSLSAIHHVEATQPSQRYTRAREKMRVTINDNNKISQAPPPPPPQKKYDKANFDC